MLTSCLHVYQAGTWHTGMHADKILIHVEIKERIFSFIERNDYDFLIIQQHYSKICLGQQPLKITFILKQLMPTAIKPGSPSLAYLFKNLSPEIAVTDSCECWKLYLLGPLQEQQVLLLLSHLFSSTLQHILSSVFSFPTSYCLIKYIQYNTYNLSLSCFPESISNILNKYFLLLFNLYSFYHFLDGFL